MEKNKYNNGKIYKIISEHSDKIYIGSTCESSLSRRLSSHKKAYKRWLAKKTTFVTSFDLLKLGDTSILLLENCNCNNKDELRARERYYIELNKDNIINKQLPTQTQKEWNCKNKDLVKKLNKEYCEQNKKKISEQRKNFYNNNKEKILKYKTELIECECGAKIQRGNSVHVKSKKHIKLILKDE